jgi:hypothetical protein
MSMLQMMIDTGALRNGGVDISAEPPPTPPRYLAVYADETLTKGSEIPLEANTSAVVLDTLNIGFGQAVGLKYMCVCGVVAVDDDFVQESNDKYVSHSCSAQQPHLSTAHERMG